MFVYKFLHYSLTDSHSLLSLSLSLVAPTQTFHEVHHAGFIPAHDCAVHSRGAAYGIQFSKLHTSLARPSANRHLPHTVMVPVRVETKVRKLGDTKSARVLASSESSLLQCKRPLPLETEGQAGIFSWGLGKCAELTCYSGIAAGLYLSLSTHYTSWSPLRR